MQVLGVDYQDTQPSLALDLVEQTGVTYPLVADLGARRCGCRSRCAGCRGGLRGRGRCGDRSSVVVRTYDQLADLVEEHLGVYLLSVGPLVGSASCPTVPRCRRVNDPRIHPSRIGWSRSGAEPWTSPSRS